MQILIVALFVIVPNWKTMQMYVNWRVDKQTVILPLWADGAVLILILVVVTRLNLSKCMEIEQENGKFSVYKLYHNKKKC